MFQQVVIKLNALLEIMKPQGPINPPAIFGGDLDDPKIHEIASKQQALGLLEGVQQADSALPLGKASHLANVLKSDLGEVVMRRRLVYGNAKMMRAMAAEMDLEDDRKQNPKTPRKRRKERK
jgi:hypothetical protein